MAELIVPDPGAALLLLLASGAVFAGFVDAVVGGGGLVQIPLLFGVFPNATPAVLFGTNKVASVVGTASAAVQYARRIPLDWRMVLPAIPSALLFSWLGARSVAHFPPDLLRPIVVALLVGVAFHTFRHKEFGIGPDISPSHPALRATVTSAILGFYDGFFGPGTGSFLVFAYVRILGLDFLRASAFTKLTNVATNVAAIHFFAGHGAVLWLAAAIMATANLAGALLGSYMALRRGAPFIRRVFLYAVCTLIAKLSWDIATH